MEENHLKRWLKMQIDYWEGISATNRKLIKSITFESVVFRSATPPHFMDRDDTVEVLNNAHERAADADAKVHALKERLAAMG